MATVEDKNIHNTVVNLCSKNWLNNTYLCFLLNSIRYETKLLIKIIKYGIENKQNETRIPRSVITAILIKKKNINQKYKLFNLMDTKPNAIAKTAEAVWPITTPLLLEAKLIKNGSRA